MPGKASRHTSVKHDIIDKDNSRVVIAVAITVFVVVFCGFAMKTLFSQSLYHNRVIGEKEKTRDQLISNKEAVEELENSYVGFVNESENILGGDPNGEGPVDGNNAKIVLDSLPGKYDYPALSSSFEKILVDGGYSVGSIGGQEDSASTVRTPTSDAKPISIPYTFEFNSTLAGTKDLLRVLERSIRPMNVDQLNINVSGSGELKTNVTLHTFYTQPKTFELGTKEVK